MIKSFLLLLIFFPVIIFKDAIKVPGRSVFKRIIGSLFGIWLGFMWWGVIKDSWEIGKNIAYDLGLIDKNADILVQGSSMLPTITDGSKITVYNPKKHGINRKDIVSFQNPQTEQLHFLKRVIGLPGEKIFLQNGRVFLNDEAISEPYVYEQKGTYGNTFALDCESVTVPKDSYWVMGDNRTVSWDSRAIGFVHKDEIDGVVKSKESPQTDAEDFNQEEAQVDIDSLVDELNKRRMDFGSISLVETEFLSNVSKDRVQSISVSLESWKKGKNVLDRELQLANYRYNLAHEYVAFGNFNAEDLISQIWENQEEKEQFLSRKYTEIGVSSSLVAKGDCQIPLTVIILSWPAVPSYEQKDIDFWLNENKKLEKILEQLQNGIGRLDVDQKELRDDINLFATLSQMTQNLVLKMEKREWLSEIDQIEMKTYGDKIKQAEEILKKYN